MQSFEHKFKHRGQGDTGFWTQSQRVLPPKFWTTDYDAENKKWSWRRIKGLPSIIFEVTQRVVYPILRTMMNGIQGFLVLIYGWWWLVLGVSKQQELQVMGWNIPGFLSKKAGLKIIETKRNKKRKRRRRRSMRRRKGAEAEDGTG